jgi:hypothetical protein
MYVSSENACRAKEAARKAAQISKRDQPQGHTALDPSHILSNDVRRDPNQVRHEGPARRASAASRHGISSRRQLKGQRLVLPSPSVCPQTPHMVAHALCVWLLVLAFQMVCSLCVACYTPSAMLQSNVARYSTLPCIEGLDAGSVGPRTMSNNQQHDPPWLGAAVDAAVIWPAAEAGAAVLQGKRP